MFELFRLLVDQPILALVPAAAFALAARRFERRRLRIAAGAWAAYAA